MNKNIFFKVQLTDYQSENVRSPQFSNDFQNLVWLQNQARGPHFQCSKLMMVVFKINLQKF